MKKKRFSKKHLIAYSILVFAFVNFMLPAEINNDNGNPELQQLTTIAYADGETDEPEIEQPFYKPLRLWDWFISKFD